MLVQTLKQPYKINLKAWTIWGIASSFYLYEFLHRVAPSVMLMELGETFNVSGSQLGNLSACYYYSYALMQIPVGLLLDKYGTRILLSFSALCIAFGSFIFGITSDLHVAQAGRLFIGIGSAFSFASCLKLAASWFHTKKFALVVGLTNLMGTMGALLAGQPLAILVNNYGWRLPIMYSAAISLIFAIIIWVYIRDKKPTTYLEKKIVKKFNFWQILKQVILQKQLWYIALFGCCMVIPIVVLSELWEVDYLVKKFNMTKATAALISSYTFIGIAFGGPIIGFLADKSGKKVTFMRAGNSIAIITTIIMLYAPNLTTLSLSILHFVFGFSTSSMLLCFSLNRSYVPEYAHATAIGLTNSVITFGSVLCQPLIGYLLDKANLHENMYFEVHQYQLSFVLLPTCQILGSLILFLIKDNIELGKQCN